MSLTYHQLVQQMASYLVSCNLESHKQLLEEGEQKEYDEIKADFPNYGTDIETAKMVFEGALHDCLAVAKEMQSHKFK